MKVINITAKDFYGKVLKDPNVKVVSMLGGKYGADYEVILKDRTSKCYEWRD